VSFCSKSVASAGEPVKGNELIQTIPKSESMVQYKITPLHTRVLKLGASKIPNPRTGPEIQTVRLKSRKPHPQRGSTPTQRKPQKSPTEQIPCRIRDRTTRKPKKPSQAPRDPATGENKTPGDSEKKHGRG
jgi:hypothetical protein